LFEHNLGDTVEQCGLVRYVPVQHRRVSAHLVAQAAHGQAVDTVTVDDPQQLAGSPAGWPSCWPGAAVVGSVASAPASDTGGRFVFSGITLPRTTSY